MTGQLKNGAALKFRLMKMMVGFYELLKFFILMFLDPTQEFEEFPVHFADVAHTWLVIQQLPSDHLNILPHLPILLHKQVLTLIRLKI